MPLFGPRDILSLCFCWVVHFVYRYHQKPRLFFPPGLPKWPIVGNAFQISLKRVHVFYKQLGQKLGSKILYMESLGQSIIVINDVNIARELLEKRSSLYSSRPAIPMITDVAQVKLLLGFMPHSDRWRHQRRMVQQYFSPKMIHRQQIKLLEFVRKDLLPNLYEMPEDADEHVRNCIGGISISMTYGLPIRRRRESLIKTAEETFTNAAEAGAPGRFLVIVLPALMYIPGWIPGATFRKVAQEVREQMYGLMEKSYQMTLKSMSDGTVSDSFILENVEKIKELSEPDFRTQEQHIKELSCQIFGAMSETTSAAATMTFILAMLKYPEVQRKAQQEIDSVIGPGRLPGFSGQVQLPYLSAVLKEALRWNPALPMGLPHMTSEDVYEGYYIPKGCKIFANTYAILHDEEVFPNPTESNPDRFIKDGALVPDILDPSIVATFGFGRRICPGSHIALSTFYLIAASILALFDISPIIGEDGKPVATSTEFSDTSLVSGPLPFQCRFAPRREKDVGGLLHEHLGTDVILV